MGIRTSFNTKSRWMRDLSSGWGQRMSSPQWGSEPLLMQNPAECGISFSGWGQRIRTSTNRFRVCCPAVRRAPIFAGGILPPFKETGKLCSRQARTLLHRGQHLDGAEHARDHLFLADNFHAFEQRRADLLAGNSYAHQTKHLPRFQP